MKQFILLTSLFFVSIISYAQDDTENSSEDYTIQIPMSKPGESPATLEYSTENITVRRFDEKKWQEIVGGRNYADKRTRETPEETRSSREQARPSNGTRSTDGKEDDARYSYDDDESETIDMSWLGPIGEIIFYVAIAAIVAIILVQVIRTTSFKANPKRTNNPQQTADDIQDITTLDTDNLILRAHTARDYKLAIRLYFLDLLKKLNENGMITWTKDKTNRDYLSELFSKQYHFEEIRKLTTAYEMVWYGEHFPSEERYNELRDEFQEINQKFKPA